MREIKFRVWHSGLKRWFDTDSDFCVIQEYGVLCLNLNATYKQQYLLNGQEDLIVNQYTGLKDKNGNEIYEGDIVEGAFEYLETRVVTTHVVRWGYAGWNPYVNKNPDYESDSCEETKVIGNIYENPELLEKN